MKVLRDTHAFLWASMDDRRLSATARRFFADNNSALLMSAASLWEIAIKVGLRKYVFNRGFLDFVNTQVRDPE